MKNIKIDLSSLGFNTTIGFFSEKSIDFNNTAKDKFISVKTFIDEGGDIDRIVINEGIVIQDDVIDYANKITHEINGTVDKERLLKKINQMTIYKTDNHFDNYEYIEYEEIEKLIKSIKEDLI